MATAKQRGFGLFSKLWAPFGYRLYYGTYYVGVPKRDPNFGSYPFGSASDFGNSAGIGRDAPPSHLQNTDENEDMWLFLSFDKTRNLNQITIMGKYIHIYIYVCVFIYT